MQSTAHEWIHLLSAVLKQALDHGGYVPERDAKQLGTILVSEAESTYGIDGTERLRQRPHDPKKQKYYYSGDVLPGMNAGASRRFCKKKRIQSRISLLVDSIRAKSII